MGGDSRPHEPSIFPGDDLYRHTPKQIRHFPLAGKDLHEMAAIKERQEAGQKPAPQKDAAGGKKFQGHIAGFGGEH